MSAIRHPFSKSTRRPPGGQKSTRSNNESLDDLSKLGVVLWTMEHTIRWQQQRIRELEDEISHLYKDAEDVDFCKVHEEEADCRSPCRWNKSKCEFPMESNDF